MEIEKQPYEETVKKLFGFLLDAGFVYEYTYDKGSDSSCVYILRFRKSRDFIDLRTVSGGAACFVRAAPEVLPPFASSVCFSSAGAFLFPAVCSALFRFVP